MGLRDVASTACRWSSSLAGGLYGVLRATPPAFPRAPELLNMLMIKRVVLLMACRTEGWNFPLRFHGPSPGFAICLLAILPFLSPWLLRDVVFHHFFHRVLTLTRLSLTLRLLFTWTCSEKHFMSPGCRCFAHKHRHVTASVFFQP